MDLELLTWRTLFAGVAAALDKPDATQRIRQLMGQFAPQLEGGAADQLFFEFCRLKQGGQVTIHDDQVHPAADGIMVITYQPTNEGWIFTPNERHCGAWRRPGSWTHWGHMVLIPTHGPDGHPILFDECQDKINSVRLKFTDENILNNSKIIN